MLSSINFLFLLSLGFISWSILCYLKQIEELTDFTKPRLQEALKEEILNIMTTIPKPEPLPSSHQNTYDLYINFLGIIICIYALAKITHIAEIYMAKRIRHTVYIPSVDERESEEPAILNDLQDQQENLKLKLNKLEKQNQDIKFKLRTVMENDATTSSTNLEEKIKNVFITNKHIHVNRQIYINEGRAAFNVSLAKKDQEKPSNIWDKYMELKDSLVFKTKDQVSTPMPVIMSSEELKKIKAIF